MMTGVDVGHPDHTKIMLDVRGHLVINFDENLVPITFSTEELRMYGKAGGHARAKALSRRERSESARIAVNARWKKYYEEQRRKASTKPTSV